MACPQAADGEGLQIWKAAANILNKLSQTADKGWSSSLGVGCGAKIPHCKNLAFYKMFQSTLDQDFHWQNLSN